EVAELADRLGRHEAGSQQPVLEQLAQPLRIGNIGLAPGHVLDVAGVAEKKLEVVLEQVPDRLPVDTGRLHRHVRHAETLQPIAQCEQIGGHRRGALDQFPPAPPPPRAHHRPRHPPPLHLEPATALITALHRKPPSRSLADEPAGGSPRQSRVWSTCSRHSSESRRAPGATLSSDSQVPSFAGLNAAADPIFIRRGWPATRPSSLSPSGGRSRSLASTRGTRRARA